MKKLLAYLFVVLGCGIYAIPSTVSVADSTNNESDVSILFDKTTQGKPTPNPGVTEVPKPGEGDKMTEKSNPLPQTGELLASLIILLTGVALIILTLGVFTMKKICDLDYRELV